MSSIDAGLINETKIGAFTNRIKGGAQKTLKGAVDVLREPVIETRLILVFFILAAKIRQLMGH